MQAAPAWGFECEWAMLGWNAMKRDGIEGREGMPSHVRGWEAMEWDGNGWGKNGIGWAGMVWAGMGWKEKGWDVNGMGLNVIECD